MLKTLNASTRNCSSLLSPMGNFLNKDMSTLYTFELLSPLRGKSPKAPTGISKAQGLNQLTGVRTWSAAIPPCEMVRWHAAFEFAGTGPGVKGSAMTLGRE